MTQTLEPMRDHLDSVRVVLVQTSHPGNIGAAARAMKTMGLRRLCLVDPLEYPSAEATARASGADDILADAIVYSTLAEAVADCTLVLGTSARRRSLQWPELSAREAALEVSRRLDAGPVAVVFGRERTGLSNEELDCCHYLVHIPCDEAFSSLNLAAAVQVLAYEIRTAGPSEPVRVEVERGEDPAPAEAVEGFYQHLQATLLELGFLNAENPRHLMRRLRRLFNRVQLSHNEVQILRGILSATQGRKRPRG